MCPSVVMRAHAYIALATILVLSFAPGVHANKGSAMCGAYLPVDAGHPRANPPRRPLDYSACKYGHMSVNDPSPAGEGCMRKPAGKCEVCTRESGAGNTRNHTCACLTEAQRTKVYDKIKDARLQLGGVLLGMGALWLAHSVWVMTDDDRLDRYSFGDRDGCSPGTFSTVNWRAVHLPAPHFNRRRAPPSSAYTTRTTRATSKVAAWDTRRASRDDTDQRDRRISPPMRVHRARKSPRRR